MKKLRVLFLVTWFSSADEDLVQGIFHYEQAMELKQYCNVILYWPNDESSLNNEITISDNNGLQILRRKKNKKSRWAHYKNCIEDIININKKTPIDIIHAHCALNAGLIAMLTSMMIHKPYLVTEHSPVEMMHLDSWKYRYKYRLIYKFSKANICVSNDLQKKLEGEFKSRFQTIYNGVSDPNQVDDDGVEYAANSKVNCCIIAGFYDKEVKGFQYLLPAMRNLKLKGMEILLHICGGGTYFEYYKHVAEELGIEDICIFYGHCNKKKMYSIIRQMQFGISSSIYESAGIAVQEQLMLGKPMIVTRSGGTDSLVDSSCAIVVEGGSIKALEVGIEKLLVNYDQYNSEAIAENAIKRYELKGISQQYFGVYENCISKQ